MSACNTSFAESLRSKRSCSAYAANADLSDAVGVDPNLGSLGASDVRDANIRSKRSRDEATALSSPSSKRWRIVTSLQPKDFAEALISTEQL